MLLISFLVAFLSLKQAKNEGEFCATLGNRFPSQSRDARKKNRERNPTWTISQGIAKSSHAMWNSKGQQLQDKFRALSGVHYIHTIYFFEAQEVRSPTLQTVCKSELKWRSYGHLKTTAPSWKVISQALRNDYWVKDNFSPCAKFRKH